MCTLQAQEVLWKRTKKYSVLGITTCVSGEGDAGLGGAAVGAGRVTGSGPRAASTVGGAIATLVKRTKAGGPFICPGFGNGCEQMAINSGARNVLIYIIISIIPYLKDDTHACQVSTPITTPLKY